MASFLKTVSVLFLLLSHVSVCVYGKDFGVRGHVFKIEEEDLLQHIKERLRSFSEEEMRLLQDSIQTKYVQNMKQPKAVEGLKESEEYRCFYHDPTVCAHQDVRDQEGRVVVAKGTCVNPLKKNVMLESLLLFDATQEEHVTWAKEQDQDCDWVLVKGRPFDLEEEEKRPVYFDQFGALTKKFGVQQIPARLSVEGDRIKVEEIPIGKSYDS
jgi:conjugal transfer pilus assembly protein TraW